MNIINRSIYTLITGAIVLTSCNHKPAKPPAEKAAAAPPAVLETVAAISDNPTYTLTLPGELLPYEQVLIYPKVRGFIKKIYAERGSQVRKGQLLALLEAPELSQQYLSAQSDERKLYENYLYSKQAYQRLQKAAAKTGAVAAIELDKAYTQLRADSAAYNTAGANKGVVSQMQDYLRIVAPFDGIITDRNFSVGALVGDNATKGAALFAIAQQTHLRLTVAIPEKHAQSINDNTVVTFTVSDRPGKVFSSKLSRNSGLLQSSSRSVMAEFDVDNKDGALNGGEYAQVKLILRRPDATIWVPATSVVRAQSGVFILRKDADGIKRIPVIEGIKKDTLQEVFGEVTVDQQIIKKGSEEIHEKK
jgi:membrane fusion protein (multidrug efflux system)